MSGRPYQSSLPPHSSTVVTSQNGPQAVTTRTTVVTTSSGNLRSQTTQTTAGPAHHQRAAPRAPPLPSSVSAAAAQYPSSSPPPALLPTGQAHSIPAPLETSPPTRPGGLATPPPVMATALSGADRIPDDVDYSISHRAPPSVPSVPYNHSQAGQQPEHGDKPGAPARRTTSAAGASTGGASSSGGGGGADAASLASSSNNNRRRGSFGFLRRSSSNTPTTRIGQAHAAAAAAADKSSSHQRAKSHIPQSPTQNSSGEREVNMLRKSSKVRQQQQAERERLEWEAKQQRTRSPPRLPSHNPLPQISSFGGDENHSNSHINHNNNNQQSSYAAQQSPSYSNTYTDPGLPPPIPVTANNFSRPNMPTNAYYDSGSSSPAYATRPTTHGSTPPSAAGGKSVNGEYVDSMPRTESMTHRGRYSFASSIAPVNVNSPRRVRRRKDPTPLNILIIGAKNCGKTSFISFLRHTLALPPSKRSQDDAQEPVMQQHSKTSFTAHYLETEMDGERIGLTLWDSAGLEKNIVDLQLREMTAFIESKFEETFTEEQKVMRSPGVKDTHIHCVFLMLDPVRLDATVAASTAFTKSGVHLASALGLEDDFDMQVMRALWGKTTIVPIISKADTLTIGHMSFLKRAVWASLQGAKLDPLESLDLEGNDLEEVSDEDEDEDSETSYESANVELSATLDGPAENGNTYKSKKRTSHARQFSKSSTTSLGTNNTPDELPYLPMSVLSPDPYDLPPYAPKSRSSIKQVVGRRFAWGIADPNNAEHCDFTRLRDSIFSEWRSDLRDLSRSKWYENWRTSRLKNLPGSKQRIRGGVTPVASVPREGRTSPKDFRSFSAQSMHSGANVPRTTSGHSSQHQPLQTQQMQPSAYGGPVGMAVTTPGMAGSKVSMSSDERGMYRHVEEYR